MASVLGASREPAALGCGLRLPHWLTMEPGLICSAHTLVGSFHGTPTCLGRKDSCNIGRLTLRSTAPLCARTGVFPSAESLSLGAPMADLHGVLWAGLALIVHRVMSKVRLLSLPLTSSSAPVSPVGCSISLLWPYVNPSALRPNNRQLWLPCCSSLDETTRNSRAVTEM